MFTVLGFINRITPDPRKWVTVNDMEGRELWSSTTGDELAHEIEMMEVKHFNIEPDNVNIWVEL